MNKKDTEHTPEEYISKDQGLKPFVDYMHRNSLQQYAQYSILLGEPELVCSDHAEGIAKTGEFCCDKQEAAYEKALLETTPIESTDAEVPSDKFVPYCECSIHGKQDIVCIHPRLGIYLCAKCNEEWPEPTVAYSYISNVPLKFGTISMTVSNESSVSTDTTIKEG